MTKYIITRRKLLSRDFCKTEQGVNGFSKRWPKGAPFELKTFVEANKNRLSTIYVFDRAFKLWEEKIRRKNKAMVIQTPSRNILSRTLQKWWYYYAHGLTLDHYRINKDLTVMWKVTSFRKVLRELVAVRREK